MNWKVYSVPYKRPQSSPNARRRPVEVENAVTEERSEEDDEDDIKEDLGMGLRSRNRVQGDPSGPRLHFVDFDLAVTMSALFCLGSCKYGRLGTPCK